MLIYDAKNLGPLTASLKRKEQAATSAASLALNSASTLAIKESIKEITETVNLSPSYINRKISVMKRANDRNLKVIIGAFNPRVLLTEYPFTQTGRKVSVSVNKAGAMREIPKAFIARNLASSGARGVALRYADALAYFEKVHPRGKPTSKKAARLARLRGKVAKIKQIRETAKGRKLSLAERKAVNGFEVLHGRTINQLFDSVRVDIQPQLQLFLRKEFIRQLDRLTV